MILNILSHRSDPSSVVLIPDFPDEKGFTSHRVVQAPPGSGASAFVTPVPDPPKGKEYVFDGRFVFPAHYQDYERFRRMFGQSSALPVPLHDVEVSL